jgi:hypothetical protein
VKHLLVWTMVIVSWSHGRRVCAWCLAALGEFQGRTCGFVRGIAAGNHRAAPARRFERSREREVNGPYQKVGGLHQKEFLS